MKKKILCALCAAAVLLLSLSIFAAATHINIREESTDVGAFTAVNFGRSSRMLPKKGRMGDPKINADTPDANGTTDGGVVGGENGTADTPMDGVPNGDMTPSDPADGNGGMNDGMNDDTNDGIVEDTTDGIVEDTTDGSVEDTTDGVQDMLPETNVPDTDIGGAAPDNDSDGITNAGDSDDDGDGLLDKVDPDADGNGVNDTDQTPGVVGIVLAVIIVLAIIAVILAVVPKKNNK